MPPTTRKSFAYYTIIICLVLIGGAFLWALLWQPSFAHGYLAVPYRQGRLFFPLWTILPALLALALFLYCSVKTVKARYPLEFLRAALLSGLVFLFFSFLLRGWFSYRSVSTGSSNDTDFLTPYSWLLTAARALVILVLIVLVYQWRQAKGHNAQHQDAAP
jgi:heme/copper-type cytochrome/quinol oxidase subunit 2